MTNSPCCYRAAGILQRLFGAVLLAAVAHITASAAPNEAEQRSRIDAEVAGFDIQLDRRGRVFFLGFAGYGEERVFAEEIKLAAVRVGAKYGSKARTLLLINDRRDLESYPLATHDNLGYALRSLGRLMNPERDMLFLVLSSHGDRGGMIEVSNAGMDATGLSATTVSSFLRQAGIKRRVIVVSACFSGAFIEPLADDHSIVITAASKSRTSFGCSDERHLTYFGEALFQETLPGARSLRAAFESTKKIIRTREKEERLTRSLPQAHFGAGMEEWLARFEALFP
jgi:hypothetical protein